MSLTPNYTFAKSDKKFNLEDFIEVPNVLFTTLRTRFHQGKITLPLLDYHVERLFKSAEVLGTVGALSPDEIKKRIVELMREELTQITKAKQQLLLRLLLQNGRLELFVEPYREKWSGEIAAITVKAQRKLPSHKLTKAAECLQARRAALDAGAEEALLVDEAGYLTEGAWSNLFWFDRDGVLNTAEHNVLPGVVRRLLLETNECQLQGLHLNEVWTRAQELFVTQSTSGITALSTLDGRQIGTGEHPLTEGLCRRFNEEIAKRSVPIE